MLAILGINNFEFYCKNALFTNQSEKEATDIITWLIEFLCILGNMLKRRVHVPKGTLKKVRVMPLFVNGDGYHKRNMIFTPFNNV